MVIVANRATQTRSQKFIDTGKTGQPTATWRALVIWGGEADEILVSLNLMTALNSILLPFGSLAQSARAMVMEWIIANDLCGAFTLIR